MLFACDSNKTGIRAHDWDAIVSAFIDLMYFTSPFDCVQFTLSVQKTLTWSDVPICDARMDCNRSFRHELAESPAATVTPLPPPFASAYHFCPTASHSYLGRAFIIKSKISDLFIYTPLNTVVVLVVTVNKNWEEKKRMNKLTDAVTARCTEYTANAFDLRTREWNLAPIPVVE